MNKKVATSGGH